MQPTFTNYGGPPVQQTFYQESAPVQQVYSAPSIGDSSGKFKKLNACACLLAVVVFGLLIAAVAVDWYQYEDRYTGAPTGDAATRSPSSFELNSTRLDYDLMGVTTTIDPSGGAETSSFEEHDSDDEVAAIFTLCQAFSLIALILAGFLALFLTLVFADAVRNKLLFLAGMFVIRVFLVAIALLVLVSVVIAFLGFLGITDAFSEDIPGCQIGFCRRFRDNTEDELGMVTVQDSRTGTTVNALITRERSWGPQAGWYIVLVTIPLTVFLAILLIVNKFPIPIDSVGVGEAL